MRDGAGARACLNELVTDALTLVPDCLVYLRRLENPAVFRFCAIPQVMAIATLDKCFNNEDVFTGVVKVRKGLAVSMILDSADLDGVEKWFRSFATTIKGKADPVSSQATSASFFFLSRCCLLFLFGTDKGSLAQRRRNN